MLSCKTAGSVLEGPCHLELLASLANLLLGTCESSVHPCQILICRKAELPTLRTEFVATGSHVSLAAKGFGLV